MRNDESRAALWTQLGLTCVFGCAAYVAVARVSPNPYEALLAGLIAGFGGVWLAMFCYVWARFGWRAARTLRMDPRDNATREFQRRADWADFTVMPEAPAPPAARREPPSKRG